MADGWRVVQQVGGSVTPFFHDWFLYTARIMFGVYTDLFGNLDTIWFWNKSENKMEKI